MFTGIVEEVGTIDTISRGANSAVLTIRAEKVLAGTKVGDSIVVNGICLTVTRLMPHAFTADVMHETLNRSSLANAMRGAHVNLERAMAADGRFGGHIVSGHVDGTGRIVEVKKDDNAIWYTIQATPQLMRYIVEKGSVTIDGISLTVAKVAEDNFSISAIPHTVSQTVLKDRKVGAVVNLETDIIGKYVEKLLFKGQPEEITEEIAKKIQDSPIESVEIRSVLTCESKKGVCAKCYGRNLATGRKVEVGEAVGTIAAQSIGEPGTQLTMRTFHTGGVAGDDITQGLPRVEELFEARKPKHPGLLTENAGTVHIGEENGIRKVTVTSEDGEQIYTIPYGSKLAVTEGMVIAVGDRLTEGSLNPHDILRISGVRATQRYLVQQVLGVYKSQGVEINDKHIEVMVRQMMRKIRIEEAGDTYMLPGEYIDVAEFEAQNAEMLEKGLQPAEGRPVLLGITKASLATDSFLSAASFQETTRVLTDAAIKGKVDPLLGLKENVIIGKLIPAGTGMNRYRDIKIKYNTTNSDQQ